MDDTYKLGASWVELDNYRIIAMGSGPSFNYFIDFWRHAINYSCFVEQNSFWQLTILSVRLFLRAIAKTDFYLVNATEMRRATY